MIKFISILPAALFLNLVLMACATTKLEDPAPRTPAQEEYSEAAQYAKLYVSLGDDTIAREPLDWEQYKLIEARRFVCTEDGGPAFIVTGGDAYQRRKRKFKLIPYFQCKGLPDKSPAELVQDAQLRN